MATLTPELFAAAYEIAHAKLVALGYAHPLPSTVDIRIACRAFGLDVRRSEAREFAEAHAIPLADL